MTDHAYPGVGMQLATGGEGSALVESDAPRQADTRKTIGLDLAYADWKFARRRRTWCSASRKWPSPASRPEPFLRRRLQSRGCRDQLQPRCVLSVRHRLGAVMRCSEADPRANDWRHLGRAGRVFARGLFGGTAIERPFASRLLPILCDERRRAVGHLARARSGAITGKSLPSTATRATRSRPAARRTLRHLDFQGSWMRESFELNTMLGKLPLSRRTSNYAKNWTDPRRNLNEGVQTSAS